MSESGDGRDGKKRRKKMFIVHFLFRFFPRCSPCFVVFNVTKFQQNMNKQPASKRNATQQQQQKSENPVNV